MHAIDTSLLYALFNEADKWHQDAKAVVAAHRPVLVPPGILQETLDLIRLREGDGMARAALAWLRKSGQVQISSDKVEASHRAAVAAAGDAAHRRLSFADLWCIAHAIEHGLPLLTRDADQVKALKAWKP